MEWCQWSTDKMLRLSFIDNHYFNIAYLFLGIMMILVICATDIMITGFIRLNYASIFTIFWKHSKFVSRFSAKYCTKIWMYPERIFNVFHNKDLSENVGNGFIGQRSTSSIVWRFPITALSVTAATSAISKTIEPYKVWHSVHLDILF